MPTTTSYNKFPGQLDNFLVKCLTCNSLDCRIEVDFASHPEDAWSHVKIICEKCSMEETIEAGE